MNSRPALLLACLFLAACHHAKKQPAATEAAPVATVQPIPNPTPAPAPTSAPTLPAEYEEYYIGMIADPHDPTFAYQPGTVTVRARPERFRYDGRGGAAEFLPLVHRGPVTTARMANYHPEPTTTELVSALASTQRTLALVTEQNQALVARLQEMESGEAPATADATAIEPGAPAIAAIAKTPAAAAAAIPEPDFDSLNILQPNSEYAIELDPRFFESAATPTNNPFVQLYQPSVTLRDVSLVVSAALPGPNPTAILNDRPLSIGEQFEGLTVFRIEPDRVYLRKDTFLLLCPVSEKPLKLRLPQ